MGPAPCFPTMPIPGCIGVVEQALGERAVGRLVVDQPLLVGVVCGRGLVRATVEHHDVVPAGGEPPGRRQAGDARPDDDDPHDASASPAAQRVPSDASLTPSSASALASPRRGPNLTPWPEKPVLTPPAAPIGSPTNFTARTSTRLHSRH